MKFNQDPEFLYDDFSIVDKEELQKIIKTVSRKPTKYDPKAAFLKKFTYHVFNAYRREKLIKEKKKEVEKTIKEIIKEPEIKKPTKLEVPKPVLKPKIKKFELEEAPKPIFKKSLPTREILRLDGVVISAVYKNGVYNLIEPKLGIKEIELLNKVEEKIKDKIKKKKNLIGDKEFIKKNIDKISHKLKIPIQLGFYEKANYFLIRDILNYGKIDGLMRDMNVREIICDGLNIPLRIKYKNEEAVTDILFKNQRELDNLIKKFASLSGKKLSEKEPFLSATLSSGIRIQASLTSSLADAKFIIMK